MSLVKAVRNLGSRWPRKPGCVSQFDLRNMWLGTAGLDLKILDLNVFVEIWLSAVSVGVLMAPLR